MATTWRALFLTSSVCPHYITGNACPTLGGAVTGYCYDANGMAHGFLRASGGTITTFDAPGSLGTLPASINPAGTITGYAINTTNERCYSTKRSDPNSVLAAR